MERFFVLDDENPLQRIDDKTMIIRFQYRELSEEEVKSYQVEVRQGVFLCSLFLYLLKNSFYFLFKLW